MCEMRILDCRRKPATDAPMESVPVLALRTGTGIIDDTNGGLGSPRHVLITDDATYRELSLPDRALRENLLVTGLDPRKLRSGDLLRSDSGVCLRVTFPCEPCVKLNRVRPGLAKEVLGRRGVLARVVAGGALGTGETLIRHRGVFPAIPEAVAGRALGTLRGIAAGRVTTLVHLTRMAGITRSYVRVLPRILKSAPDGTPVHRVVRTGGGLLTKHLPDQPARLREEGIEPLGGTVPEELLWTGDPYREELDPVAGKTGTYSGTCAAFGASGVA